MHKILAVITFACLSSWSYTQVLYGDLVNEGRRLAKPFEFKVEELAEGELFYELAVDRLGKVKSARLLTDKSTVLSTPINVRAKAYITKVEFEPGTYYPEFHHCTVRLKVEKKKAE